MGDFDQAQTVLECNAQYLLGDEAHPVYQTPAHTHLLPQEEFFSVDQDVACVGSHKDRSGQQVILYADELSARQTN